MADASYPVSVSVERQLDGRNRLTTAFRPILAIPHAILVGPVYWWSRSGGVGLIGAAAYVLAIVSWCSLLITGRHPQGIRDFSLFYLRWRTRSLAYMALLRDEYPPFGDGEYPTAYRVEYPDGDRNLWSVGLRIIYAIPHLIVLFFLSIAWFVTAVIAWFAILFTGQYPEGLYRFAVGYLRWSVRVETYLYLMRDEYPPFSFDP